MKIINNIVIMYNSIQLLLSLTSLLNFMITSGDVDDRKPLEVKAFTDFLFVNTLAALAAYCCFPKKPAIQVVKYTDNQLTLF